jgi:hypothetical protein
MAWGRAVTVYLHYACLGSIHFLMTFQAEDPISNSLHPYMADERKSKKGEGVVDTAKLTGTVDTNRKLR